MSTSGLRRLLLASAVIPLALGCTIAGPGKTPGEISLVSNVPGFNSGSTGEVSRFLWEPGRYVPAPSEIFFEVVARAFGAPGGITTFRLHDVTNNVTIAGSTLAVAVGPGGRFRTANLVASFPAAPVEIAVIAEPTAGTTFSIQRSAVLVQQ